MDIVELLEGSASGWESYGPIGFGNAAMERRAASEITRLREENKVMREALEAIFEGPGIECICDNQVQDLVRKAIGIPSWEESGWKSAHKARAALETTGGE